MNANCLSLPVEILLLYNVRERKKDDSEAAGIMKFFKSTERNRISSKEPSDIAERSSISSATESVQINESTCSATSSPVDDHS